MWATGGINTYVTVNLNRGQGFLKREDLAAGTTKLTVKFKWDKGNQNRDYTIKTYSAARTGIKDVETKRSGMCYTLEDGIGNWDLENNGVSPDCSKRTPQDWWNPANHDPSNAPEEFVPDASERKKCINDLLDGAKNNQKFRHENDKGLAINRGIEECEKLTYLFYEFEQTSDNVKSNVMIYVIGASEPEGDV